MEWVRLKDRLPEELVPVLITDGDAITCAALMCFHGRLSIWASYGWNGYDIELALKEITHWMPLPEPLREVDNGCP